MVERFMLPLKFCKTFFDSHLTHRIDSSDANAFRTFDWEIPNCRAIREGVMPAERCTNGVNLTTSQWRLSSIDVPSFLRFPHYALWRPASTLHLLKCCRV